MELAVAGLTVGHWTDPEARTGCTVVRFPSDTVASGEIRGGAPASREFALLEPTRLVSHIDAVVLTGGSAFGLAAADGVVAVLEDEGRGFPTANGPVPIVVALGLYDLGVGRADVRPDAAAGASAARAADADPATGAVGAGAGAMVGKWRDPAEARPGGIGIVSVTRGELAVSVILANNAAGDVEDGLVSATVRAGTFPGFPDREGYASNTVIGVVATNARLDKVGCRVVAEGAHDGLARAITPPHMRSDGDAFVAASTGLVEAPVDEVRLLAVVAVEQAVRESVGSIEG
ncbi:MAG: P1 family peptidase [Acidimicrobiales bacterium]|nr:P1 family peptidase [Acidimicrobiales bacterium]